MRPTLLVAFFALALGAPAAAAATALPPSARPAPFAARAPALPPAPMRGLIGEYGTADDLHLIFEADGELYLGEGERTLRLIRRQTPDSWVYPGRLPITLRFERDRRGAATAMILGARRLPRVDLGALAQALVREGVRADPQALRRRALAATPPAEPTPKRASDLVALTSVDPTIKLDIRYATADNFMGIVLYERSAAYLQRPAAEAVGRASRSLRAAGYGLMIHDAYRPWFVTKMFWDATPPQSHQFVADPAQGSRHNRGAAVDLTLYDLRTGRAVEMPGRYDELSHRSYPDYIGGTTRQRWLRDLLRREMEKQGFSVYAQEWWHFDYGAWRDWGIGNRTFTELATQD
jgi:D-alanyl-D-alanine dipeptidase